MAVELVMPRLSDTMEEGTVISWLASDGQVVAQGQEIAEIETDKSTLPYEAPEAGVLRILVPEGTKLRLGQPIGLIDDLTPLPGGHSVAPPGSGARGAGQVPPPRAPGAPIAGESYELQADHHGQHVVHASSPPPDPGRSAAWGPASQSGWRAPHPADEDDEGETTEFTAISLDDVDLPTQEHVAAAAAPTPAPIAPQPPVPPLAPAAPVAAPAAPEPQPEPVAAAPVVPAQPVLPAEPAAAEPVAAAAGSPGALPSNPWGEQPGGQVAPVPVTPAPPTPAVTDEGRFTPEELIAPPTAPPRPPEQRPANDGNARVQASPVARRLAEELGLDLSLIPGTGPEGRVVRADIEAAQAQGLARPPMPAGAVPAAQSEFTPPSPSGPQPPIPPVDPAPVEPDVPEQPAPEVPAQPAPEPDVPAQPAPDPDVPAEPEPQPAPVEPEVPGQPAPEPDVPAEPEPPAPEPELPADPAPEPAPELPIEPTPEPELPADPTPTPEVPVPTTDAPGPTADAEQVTLPAAQPGRGKGEPRVVELSRQGQTIARRMAESKGTIPHFTVRSEVDAEPILQLRADLASNRPDMAPPSINDLVIRATALALRAHPRLNGAYRDGRVEEYPRINIGIPVDVEDGLPVPVVQDVDRLSLGEIAERSSELIGKAREGTLRPADVASATFTVSNLGVYGVDEFTAVITPGQAAILTVGAVAGRPVARDGELTVGQTFTLTLLVDHRAVYGAPAARFLARVRKLLEHPTSLLA